MISDSKSAKVPLRDQAYISIKNDIILCALEPGSEVTEALMAQRYNLGKAPVRAALSRLFQEGLVQPLARRGYLIAPITVKDIYECMELRILLEPAATRLAIRNIDASTMKRLRKDCEKNKTAGNEKSVSFEINRRFHTVIAEASGNERMAQVICDLLGQMERSSRLLMQNHKASKMRDDYSAERADHAAILDHIEAGDADAAETAMRQHLKATRMMTIDILVRHNFAELRVWRGPDQT